jgi:hypothetical protein
VVWVDYGEGMTVDAIKNAIVALPVDDRHQLLTWLNELAYDAWDQQMVKDFSVGGRGLALLEQVKREIASGRTDSLQAGLTRGRIDREPSQR